MVKIERPLGISQFVLLTNNLKNLATYSGNPSPYALTYNSKGTASFQLPQGPSPGYKLDLFVQVVDDADGIYRFDIPTQVTVSPNNAYTATMMDDLLNSNPNSSIFQTVSAGNLESCGGVLTSFAAMLNEQASAAAATMTTTTPAPSNSTSTGTSLVSCYFSCENTALNIAYYLSSTPIQVADADTIKRSQVRDLLMDTVSNIVPSDMSSAKVLASMISAITGKPNEVSLASAVS